MEPASTGRADATRTSIDQYLVALIYPLKGKSTQAGFAGLRGK